MTAYTFVLLKHHLEGLFLYTNLIAFERENSSVGQHFTGYIMFDCVCQYYSLHVFVMTGFGLFKEYDRRSLPL